MSHQDVVSDGINTETKQLTGSSKRKRKSSVIKHNVVVNDQSQLNETDSYVKPVRTYVKRIKAERNKSGKDKSQNEVKRGMNDLDNATEERQYEVEENQNSTVEPSDMNHVFLKEKTALNSDEETVVTKAKGKGKTVSNGLDDECAGKQQQCQNCNFCAEHKQATNDSEEKTDPVSKMYTCKVCAGFGLKRVYNSLEKYKRHTKEVHEPKKDVKRFECTDCPEPVWFPTKAKYCYHLGAKHPGVIKFVCEVCTQTFKLKANYKNHMKTHNIIVQKKFSCDVCGGTFVNRAGFEAHKKRFPGPHIKQSCIHCGVSFSKEKHMRNHRCKVLLLQEAAAARDSNRNAEMVKDEKGGEVEQEGKEDAVLQNATTLSDKKPVKESNSEADMEPMNKKVMGEGDTTSGKRVLFHRLLPKKNEKLIYKQFPLQTQNVPQSVVVQEFREIDLEGGTFITAESDHPIIVRDVNGQLVQGNQILQLDINDFQPGEESQVYLADWNVVAPFVIRGKSP